MEIDLNKLEESVLPENGNYFPGLTNPSPPTPSSSPVCLELWHACAGPLISLPQKGSVVVYFPQGHLEQHQVQESHTRTYDLPPQIICRVVDVKLQAEVSNDELYAQVSLLAEDEVGFLDESVVRSLNGGEEVSEENQGIRRTIPHMFCKTLTASDTSTHGGFSVPRRAAEDCFPPLDYSQQRPSQELTAKDLYGFIWRFRHIYRGQPRRHLLTTGWSSFANKKKLKPGDAVLFLRVDDGELRLGIRRATRQSQCCVPYTGLLCQLSRVNMLSMVADALSVKKLFHIYYNPRASPAEFMVPYWKYLRSCSHPFSMGMRLKIRVETEDAVEKRYTGHITGVGDVDPIRWPNSKWRCLVVRWDDNADTCLHDRVSPWEIEQSSLVSSFSFPLKSTSKRPKMNFPSIITDIPLPDGSGLSGSTESSRFQKVLQGQEISGFIAPYNDINSLNDQAVGFQSHYPLPNTGTVGFLRTPSGVSSDHQQCTGFGESNRFVKVLQGQENVRAKKLAQIDLVSSLEQPRVANEWLQFPTAKLQWPSQIQRYMTHLQPKTSTEVSKPSPVYTYQQAKNPGVSLHTCGFDMMQKNREQNRYGGHFVFSERYSKRHDSPCPLDDTQHGLGSTIHTMRVANQLGNQRENALDYRMEHSEYQKSETYSKGNCRLFGFSLKTDEASKLEEPIQRALVSPLDIFHSGMTSHQTFPPTDPKISGIHLSPNSGGSLQPSTRRCTKVYKQESLVGRAVDLTKLTGYDDLIFELERLLDMEGLLRDPRKGWQVVYTDNVSDMMLVGDEPWQEFCDIVSKIHIFTREEVTLASRVKSYEDNCCSDHRIHH
uniref:Auxin response factor n=2 Tax=Cabomba aquatica TaxID=310672 RepID=D4HTS8_9MAGN|nr:ETTIN protein [Cabomba aquatica]